MLRATSFDAAFLHRFALAVGEPGRVPPPARTADATRRSVVPPAASRSAWLAAVWTGAGTAIIGATVGIAVVAVCWLPASGGSGHARSAIRAGLLSFLASVHGGLTVNATFAEFVPLGMTVLLGLVAWRAGLALADAVADLAEQDPVRLSLIALAQVASFTVTCLVVVPLATLGTSSAPFLGVGCFAALLFALTGGVAFLRASALGSVVAQRLPVWLPEAARVGAAGLVVYLGAGALLVGGSLTVHHDEVVTLTRQAGPGWNGAPVLLLCILAAPNALIAGASYLAGPGFAFGTGTTAAVGASTHGVLPAFPLLAALPSGHNPSWMWWGVIAVPVLAGLVAATRARRAETWVARLRDLGVGAGIAGVAGAVLAWQGGGGIGTGRLQTIGASPWQFGLAVAGELAVAGGIALALVAGAAGVQDFVAATHGSADVDGAPWTDLVDANAVTERIGFVAAEEPADEPPDDGDGSDRLAG